MKLGVNQPYFFPYLGFYQLLHAVEKFVVYDDVSFIKQGWINRNRILIRGEPSLFTIPVKAHSSSQPIREILIDRGKGNAWRSKLLRTIDNAYRRAPHFDIAMPLVEEVLDPQITQISELALYSLKVVTRHLGLKVSFVETSAAYGNEALRGQARILDICRREGASEYVNLPGGRSLYSTERFAAEGVRLRFLAPELPAYEQFGDKFVAGLSIIDVLMFNARTRVQDFLGRYSLG